MSAPTLPFGDPDHWRSFLEFHGKHPVVLARLEQLVYSWLRRGRHKLSIEMLWNVLRWQTRLEGLPDEGELFKLNNKYKAYYARLLLARHPEWGDLFELRASQADDHAEGIARLAVEAGPPWTP